MVNTLYSVRSSVFLLYTLGLIYANAASFQRCVYVINVIHSTVEN